MVDRSVLMRQGVLMSLALLSSFFLLFYFIHPTNFVILHQTAKLVYYKLNIKYNLFQRSKNLLSTNLCVWLNLMRINISKFPRARAEINPEFAVDAI